MGTNGRRQGSDGTGHRMVARGPAGGWHLTVQWRALIRGLVLCLALVGWLAPGYGGLSVAAAGTTRYVAPTGSDSGDCSVSATPCQTIGYAIGQAQDGDTISIAAGTYAEHLDIEKNLSLVGSGASTTVLDGSNSGTVVAVGMSNRATAGTLSGVTVQHGNTSGNGGGIYNSGTLTLDSSTVVSNTAAVGGGGIENTRTLTLTNSTVVSNTTTSSGSGGGIYNDGTVTLSNSTVSGKSFSTAGFGVGGIDNGYGTVTLTNSTVSGNTSTGVGGIYSLGTVTLTNTILAGNTAPSFPDCWGTLTSAGYNLVGVGDGCGLTNGVNGDQVGTSSPLNPLLGPLQDNGGPTSTMAPLPGSRAIDVVPPSKCTLSTDQRGQPRPDADDHGACDSGAVEVDYPAQLPVVTGVSPHSGLYMDSPTVVIDGSNLVGPGLTATVRFGGVLASSSIADPSGTVITATGPATSAPSIVDVTVQTSVGTSLPTPGDRFIYTSSGMLYVATSGNDGNGCLTPASPCRTLGHAVAVAASGATISVAPGIYTETVTIPTETVTIPLSLTLVGAGAGRTIVDGHQSGTVVTVNAGATVAITGVTIQNGSGSGIGISNSGTLTLSNSTVSNNRGGGIDNGGTATLSNSTVSGNTSTVFGGGIYNAYDGGYKSGTLTLTNSTVSGNSVSTAGFDGGGIYNAYGGTVTLTNSTVAGNSAPEGGGGIYDSNGGTLTLTNSTVSGNSASYEGGGIYSYYYSSPVTLTNSILAGNTAPAGPDCYASLTSGGYNLLGIGEGCALTNDVNGDQVGTRSSPLEPWLDPLADYGGPTLTMAPQPGSPALDAVPASHCPLTTDQRGQPRPDEAADGGACDIGAVEGAGPAPTISLSASNLDFGTESVDFFGVTQTVTLTNSGAVPLFLSSTAITVTGTNPQDFLETDTCAGTTIAPGASCTIDVNFWPGDAGTRSAVLSITDNAAGSPQSVALSGIGQFAVAGVSPLALDFGDQVMGTTSAAQSVTVQNNSQADLAIFGAYLDNTGAFTATTSDCFGDSIAPGESCTFDVRFTPQWTMPGWPTSATGTLFIYDNAADSPQTVSLSGNGTLPATDTPEPSGATAANTSVPPTSSPTTQPMATPTRTPTPSAALMHPTATMPAAPRTAAPTATKLVCASHPAPPPLSVDLAPHRALVAGSSRALALSKTLRSVTGGGTLPLRIRTAPHATVTASLDVVVTQVVIHGQGAHQTRTTRRVVLYHTALHGTTDTHGRFSPLLRVAYQPHRPVMATLTVRARTTCSTATRRTSLTILPLRITITPRRLVGGSPLTILLHTGGQGQVGISRRWTRPGTPSWVRGHSATMSARSSRCIGCG